MYNKMIIQHNLNPTHKSEIPNFTHVRECVDSMCGDDVTLYLKINNGIIEDAGYTGYGCAVSQAYADILIDEIIGKDIESAKNLNFAERYQETTRKKCAMLGWNTLLEVLNES